MTHVTHVSVQPRHHGAGGVTRAILTHTLHNAVVNIYDFG